MTPARLSPALAALLLVVVGCGEPEAQSPITLTTTDQGAERESSTTTSASISTTTSSAPTSTTEASSGTILSNQAPPVLELLPPGANEVIPMNEVDDYYIFARAVGVTSVTSRFESRQSAPGQPAVVWSVELRVDGTSQHLIYEDRNLSGESITTDDGVWFRNTGDEWQAGENSDLGSSEFAATMTGFASPDAAYATAYEVFDYLEFVGWQQVGASNHAVYRGDVEATLDGQPGTAEVVWSPDGYFSRVRVEFVDGEDTVSLLWTVSGAGATVVEAPD